MSHLQIGRQIFRDIHISGFGFPLLHSAGHRGNEDFVSHFLKIQTELEISSTAGIKKLIKAEMCVKRSLFKLKLNLTSTKIP